MLPYKNFNHLWNLTTFKKFQLAVPVLIEVMAVTVSLQFSVYSLLYMCCRMILLHIIRTLKDDSVVRLILKKMKKEFSKQLYETL